VEQEAVLVTHGSVLVDAVVIWTLDEFNGEELREEEDPQPAIE
jgi:hypothetical protein